jgi:hypothetical protein
VQSQQERRHARHLVQPRKAADGSIDRCESAADCTSVQQPCSEEISKINLHCLFLSLTSRQGSAAGCGTIP